MRTTVNLDDDVLDEVKQYAEDRSVGLGRAMSELLRRGLSVEMPTKVVNGLHVFCPPPGTPQISNERVRELESEE